MQQLVFSLRFAEGRVDELAKPPVNGPWVAVNTCRTRWRCRRKWCLHISRMVLYPLANTFCLCGLLALVSFSLLLQFCAASYLPG